MFAVSTTEAVILLNAPQEITFSFSAFSSDTMSISDSVSVQHVATVTIMDSMSVVDSGSGIRAASGSASSTIALVDMASAVRIPPSFIYFEDFATSKISKSKPDGTSIAAISTDPQYTVVGLGADATQSLVIWINQAPGGRLGQSRSRLSQMRLGQSEYSLRYVPYAGSISIVSVSQVKTVPTGFLVDPVNLWSYQYGVSGLWLTQYNSDGSAAAGIGEPYVPTGAPGGIAIDIVNTFAGFSPVVYIADNGIPGIVRASVNYGSLGSLNGNTTIYTPVGTIGQLACDAINGYVFAMDGMLLKRMRLDGANPVTIVNVGATVNAVFVDSDISKVYVQYGDKVVSYNYDGSSPTDILTSTNVLNADSGFALAN
jgi:hypothetical protein